MRVINVYHLIIVNHEDKIKMESYKNEKNYVMIPRSIIYLNEISELRIPIYIYFAQNRNLHDVVPFTLNHLIRRCGLTPDRHKDRANDKIRGLLTNLSSHLLVDTDNDPIPDFSNLKDQFGYRVAINHDIFDVNSNFAIINFAEIEYMMEHKTNTRNVSFAKLALVLSYIRVNKLRRGPTHEIENKPEIFFKQYKDIAIDLNISTKTVAAAITILCDLDLIVIRHLKRYKDDSDRWHTNVTIFADKKKGWERELEYGEKFLRKGAKVRFYQEIN